MKAPKDPIKGRKIGQPAYYMVKTVMRIPEGCQLPESIIKLLEIMHQFPQFEKEFPYLYFNGVIKAVKKFPKNSRQFSEEDSWRYIDEWECSFIWDYSQTSLAEYFYFLEKNKLDGKFFWEKIENVFLIKKGTLRHFVCNNEDGEKAYINDKPSKDYERILDLLGRELNAEFDKLLNIEKLINDFNDWMETPTEKDIDNDTKDKLSKLFSDIKNVLQIT